MAVGAEAPRQPFSLSDLLTFQSNISVPCNLSVLFVLSAFSTQSALTRQTPISRDSRTFSNKTDMIVSYNSDLIERLTTSSDVAAYSYDSNGNLTLVSDVDDFGLGLFGLPSGERLTMPVSTYRTYNGRLRAEVTDGVRTTYLTDALGSVTATVDSSQTVLNTYRYKPSGDLLAKTGSSPDPRFLWTGDTGSRTTTKAYAEQYNRARHYGSRQGQWTTVDPIWPDERAYGYVNGNPTSYLDQDGRTCKGTTKGNCKYPNGDPSYPRPPWGSGFAKCVSDAVSDYCSGSKMDDKTVMCMIWAETNGNPRDYDDGVRCGPMHYKKKDYHKKCKSMLGPPTKKRPTQPPNCKDECAQIRFSVYLLCNCDYGSPRAWGTNTTPNSKYCCCATFGTF